MRLFAVLHKKPFAFDIGSDIPRQTQLFSSFSALFAIGILRLHLEMDISYLCKTEKEINNIVVGDKIIK